MGLPDFGEPSLRAVYAECGDEVAALSHGLHEIALCPFRVALLHYAPVSVPVMGRDFWVFELSGAARAATAIH
jgi:hypothetical protein